MASLLELIRTSTPQERAAALAELVGAALAANGGQPVAVCDARSRTIGYLSSEVNAAATLPLPAWTEEEVAEIRRRLDNPRDGISVEEFIRRFEAASAEEKPR
jgi:hypothetical protein